MYPLGLVFPADSIPPKIVLPNLPTITHKEVFGDSNKQAIFCEFSDAVLLIANANISGVIAPVTTVACSRI